MFTISIILVVSGMLILFSNPAFAEPEMISIINTSNSSFEIQEIQTREDIVFENFGAPEARRGWVFCCTQKVYEDFMLGSDTSITGFGFVSIHNSTNFEYSIYSDLQGLPSKLLTSGTGQNITSQPVAIEKNQIWFDLEEPFFAESEKKYWFALYTPDPVIVAWTWTGGKGFGGPTIVENLQFDFFWTELKEHSWFQLFGNLISTIESNGTGGGNWNDSTTWSGGIIPTPNDKVIIKSGDTVTVSFSLYLEFLGSITVEQGGKLIIAVTPELKPDSKNGESSEHLTRPTFGLSHETFDSIVDNGFAFNNQTFPITDNHHTDFPEQTVNIGETNSFSATVYADKELKVQEFLFGIPEVGQAHLAELGVEVWYDVTGEIKQIKTVQKSGVIDTETLVATHEKTKCQAQDIEQKCDTTNISMVFQEQLKDKIMAIKAIDHKNRYQITYLNEGIGVLGESLNPMNEMLIPSPTKGEGQVLVTQIAKYSPYWIAQDGKIFEQNIFDSFKQINQTFERFSDSGNPYTRMHSEFEKLVAYEQNKATKIFDSSGLVSELGTSFAYVYPESHERITDEIRAEMLEQEKIAEQILEESKVQARW